MGGGTWTTTAFCDYVKTKGLSVDSTTGSVCGITNAQSNFKRRSLSPELDPKDAMRQCKDSEEHPNTKPVILALDVTGSMGTAATQIARKLGIIMTNLYEKIPDVEFCIMGIGDLSYDDAPIQISQFESDIRIAEQLDNVYFEFGGGCNNYESYTTAWYMGARHCDLDCWKRGGKGVIITMGDERLNPYLPKNGIHDVTGDNIQNDIETKELYTEASEKFDIYHLDVIHGNYRMNGIEKSFKEYLDDEHFQTVNVNEIDSKIVSIIENAFSENMISSPIQNTSLNENGEIVW